MKKRKLFKETLASKEPVHLTEKDLFEIAIRAVVPHKVNLISKEAMKEQIKEVYTMLQELAQEL